MNYILNKKLNFVLFLIMNRLKCMLSDMSFLNYKLTYTYKTNVTLYIYIYIYIEREREIVFSAVTCLQGDIFASR